MTETMYTILEKLSNASTVSHGVTMRARIILHAFQKLQNVEISEFVGLGRQCVGKWRRRWRESFDALLSIQMNEPHSVLVRAVVDVLSDAHRSGSPGKFSSEQIVQLISIACENPRESDRPVDVWTARELADEMEKREVVDSISPSRVGELLRQVNLQPHRQKYWCFTTEKDHEQFQQQAELVCRTYLDAKLISHRNGTRTICVDEMTSLGANERRAVTHRSIPGKTGRRECQYTRHGTLSLTGSWDVVEGKMIHTTVNETRDNADFANHLLQTFATDPNANWIVVLDNLNTHCGESTVRLVARLIGIEEHTLGNKKKRKGILGSMKSRREFLTDPSHRIRFVFLPKHSSWLNQIEVIFGIISRRVMRHGSFHSKDDLKQKLLAFIDYFNRTYAKPLNWTYHGKPTHKQPNQRPKTWREKTQNKKLEQILALVA